MRRRLLTAAELKAKQVGDVVMQDSAVTSWTHGTVWIRESNGWRWCNHLGEWDSSLYSAETVAWCSVVDK